MAKNTLFKGPTATDIAVYISLLNPSHSRSDAQHCFAYVSGSELKATIFPFFSWRAWSSGAIELSSRMRHYRRAQTPPSWAGDEGSQSQVRIGSLDPVNAIRLGSILSATLRRIERSRRSISLLSQMMLGWEHSPRSGKEPKQ